MGFALTIFLLGLTIISLVKSDVYTSYTNNAGTYNTVIKDNNAQHTPSHNTNLAQVWVNGVKVTPKDSGTTVQNKNNDTNIVDVPTYINNVNINTHARGKLRADKRTQTSYNGVNCTQKSNVKPTTVNDSTCCYISQPRKCTNKNNMYTCETKVIQACGKRCKEILANEEVYFKEDLESNSTNVLSNNRPTYSKPQHPYKQLPFNYGRYPGNRFQITQQHGYPEALQDYTAKPDFVRVSQLRYAPVQRNRNMPYYPRYH